MTPCTVSLRLMGVVLLWHATGTAQPQPAGVLRFGDEPARCGSAQTMIAHIPDLAMMRPGWIILNPALFTLPQPIQHFWYAHECAHHLLGSDELAADCWAARAGKRLGWLGQRDLDWLEENFRDNPGDAAHPPGPIRAANIRACYAG